MDKPVPTVSRYSVKVLAIHCPVFFVLISLFSDFNLSHSIFPLTEYLLRCLISSEEKQLDSLMIDISENFGVKNFETLLTSLSVLLTPV